MPAKKNLRVKQIRSGSGRVPSQRETLRGLGLRGPQSVVVVPNQAAFRGMIKKIIHLVTVEEVDG